MQISDIISSAFAHVPPGSAGTLTLLPSVDLRSSLALPGCFHRLWTVDSSPSSHVGICDLAYALGCLSGLSGVAELSPAYFNRNNPLGMSLVLQHLSGRETICQSGYCAATFVRSRCQPASRYRDNSPRLIPFATYTPGPRNSSSMASESLNQSDADMHQHHQQHSSAALHREGTPYAARAAAGAAAATTTYFPLGYREGFSQWVSQQHTNTMVHSRLTWFAF